MNTINHDISIICDAVKVVTKSDPMARDRVRQNVDARRIVYKLCRELLNITYTRIARYFDKNHASVLHGLKQFDDLFETDREFRRNYNAVMHVISSIEFDSNIIDSQDIIVDYLHLKDDNFDVQKKYDHLLKSLQYKVTEKINELLSPIDNVLIHNIIRDDKCSSDLQKTLHDILVQKNMNV